MKGQLIHNDRQRQGKVLVSWGCSLTSIALNSEGTYGGAQFSFTVSLAYPTSKNNFYTLISLLFKVHVQFQLLMISGILPNS